MRFYVTGLPRSRTAWLARLFSYGRSYCLHDAMVRPGWRDELDTLQFAAAGLSDSGLSLVDPSKLEGKVLVVRRDPAECLRSFLAMPPYPGIGKIEPRAAANILGVMLVGLDAHEAAGARVVKYEDLDDADVVRSTWNWLIGDVQPWSETHYREMRHMRVLVRPDTYEVI